MALRVLYVGGIYPVEFSLFKEAQGNPELQVKFCYDGVAFKDLEAVVCPTRVANRQDLDRVKQAFQPNLVLFRNWCPSENLIAQDEVLWHQEIYIKRQNGIRTNQYRMPAQARVVAYQSQPMAEQARQHWLPYCVSRHWSSDRTDRDIPVMMATCLPSADAGGDYKIRSMDLLIKPIIEWNPQVVQVFAGVYGGLHRAPYLAPCVRPSFMPVDARDTVSRAQIYISPTTIWYDEGCVSYKTLEAMAFGCLVITNRYVGIEQVFGQDGQYLLYSNNPQETLEKVQYYLARPTERRALADRGREWVLTTYAWETQLKRLHQELNP